MFRRSLAISLMIVLAFTTVCSVSVFAASNKSKIGNIENQIDKKQNQIDSNNKKSADLQEKIKSLEASIKSTEKDLASIQKEIAVISGKAKKINAKILKLVNKINEQQDILDSRLRSMYKNGNLGIIQVLLGSVNIQDFMSNFKLINELHKSDVEILEELEKNRDIVEAQKQELDNLKNKMNSHKSAQLEKQRQLKEDKSEVAAAKQKVEAETAVLYREIDKLEAESARLSAEIYSRQNPASQYKGSGKFAWPFPSYTRVSSEYGYRIHPITGAKKFHSGIDLAGPRGAAIVAADDGVVISAGWNSGGYGNLVVIDHGSGIATLYGHNSSLTVSSGQKVKRGQTIARCGSTGFSTGPHLHFEVKVKGSTQNPRKWI